MSRLYLIFEGACTSAGIENDRFGVLPLDADPVDILEMVRLFHQLEVVDQTSPEAAGGDVRGGLRVWLVQVDGPGRWGSDRDLARATRDIHAKGRYDRPDLSLSMDELAEHSASSLKIAELCRPTERPATSAGSAVSLRQHRFSGGPHPPLT